MNKNKRILWIPSYPKSGNTWIRLILCGLFFTKEGIINDFKILNKIPKFDNLNNFKFIKNISLKDYKLIFSKKDHDEKTITTYSQYWLEAQKKIKAIEGNFLFFKTHNARVKINSNFFTNESTSLGFIYISRDPRDIVVSYAEHMKKDIDFTIDYLINGQIMGKEKKENFMPEITLSWQDHFSSWEKFDQVPNLFIKYENLLTNFDQELNNIINFFDKNFNIEISNKTKKIKNIINSTSFQNLKKIEQQKGFAEKIKGQDFFRIGKSKQWKKTLNINQKKLIENKFKKLMTDLNYL